MPFSLEKLTFAAALKSENEKDLKGEIPAVRRSKFAARIKAIEAEGAKMAKEKAKADEKLVISSINKFLEGDNKEPGLVALLPVAPDLKLLTNALASAMKKAKGKKPVCIIAADHTKVVHLCYVPEVIVDLANILTM
jgi:hypothetical protein